AGVPYVLDNLLPLGELALERLREHFRNHELDEVQRLHSAFGLAEFDEAPLEFLIEHIATAPAAECRNLVSALAHAKDTALNVLSRRAASTTDAAAKARYAILALHLGDLRLAQASLRVRGDPVDRTTLIHAYTAWHGHLATVAE